MIKPKYKFAYQGQLIHAIKSLFPGHKTQNNARKVASITNPTTGNYLELDLWIPSLNIGFEFQDTYHYTTFWYSHVPLSTVKTHDHTKEQGIRARGDTLIIVPYWWDAELESLANTIRHQRPDLLRDYHIKSGNCIPLNPPSSLTSKQWEGKGIPDIGDLMLASFPLNVGFGESISKKTPWWLGEKYDGLRCCWNPKRGCLYTRYANEILLPDAISSHLPQLFLDTELWFGRGDYQDAQRLATHDETATNWSFFRTIMFDKADYYTRDLPFEDRYTILFESSYNTHPFLILAPRLLCLSAHNLSKLLNEILDNEGEGVMLRKPGSEYKVGRSNLLLKLKAARADKEALVVDVLPSGDVQLQLPDGAIFEVLEKNALPNLASGDVITFSYDRFSRRDLPTNAQIIRKRKDIEWKDVVSEEKKNPDRISFTHFPTSKVVSYSESPRGHYQNEKNVKLFFENFAKRNNFDPLVATNWYNISRRELVKMKGGLSFLKYYDYSWIKALMTMFPDIGLHESHFRVQPKKYWKSMEEKRKVFDEFAKDQGFDPLVAANWYDKDLVVMRSSEVVTKHKKIQTVLSAYKGSLMKALVHLYPEIGLKVRKFRIAPTGYWDDLDNRRQFFERYAKYKNFDPLVAANWYSSSTDMFTAVKGGKPVISKYGGSAIDALVDCFPEVKFNLQLFQNNKKNTFKSPQARREFMINYAKENGFDPLIPYNWGGVARKSKSFSAILRYHKRRIHQAVYDLFPEVLTNK